MAANTRDIRKLSRQLRAAADRAPEQAKLIIAKTANDVVADAKRRAPVDTGALRDSIDWTPYNDGLGAEIGTTVSYAPYQEFGTWKMSPHPFLNPAADKYFPRAEKAFQTLLNRLV